MPWRNAQSNEIFTSQQIDPGKKSTDNTLQIQDAIKKIEEIKWISSSRQEIDNLNAEELAKQIKEWWKYENYNQATKEPAWINDLINEKSKDEAIAILDNIYYWFNNWSTEVEIVNEKQKDEWINMDIKIKWKIDINWEEKEFMIMYYFFLEAYTKVPNNKEFLELALKKYWNYSPNIIRYSSKNLKNKILDLVA